MRRRWKIENRPPFRSHSEFHGVPFPPARLYSTGFSGYTFLFFWSVLNRWALCNRHNKYAPCTQSKFGVKKKLFGLFYLPLLYYFKAHTTHYRMSNKAFLVRPQTRTSLSKWLGQKVQQDNPDNDLITFQTFFPPHFLSNEASFLPWGYFKPWLWD